MKVDRIRLVGFLGVLAVGATGLWPIQHGLGWTPRLVAASQQGAPLPADALEGGVGWLNTRTPIHLEDLRGKLVLLDFWTYCCINCHHVLPDLEKLEKKYANQLVVIGVHTAKFDAEKNTDNIRQKVAEYRIRHPVINDANQVLWNKFGVSSWPTLVLLDATGHYMGALSGEGNYEVLDRAIGKLVEQHRARGELNEAPLFFEPEMDRTVEGPLLYPGKILADEEGKRLFITDTGHNRIVITGLDGRFLEAVGGGETGLKDGSFAEARFNRPQGVRLIGGTLYVADTENHAIRAVDLQSKQVRTIAGTGEQSYRRSGGGKARETGLNSPWDLLADPADPSKVYVAMAGPHQIWLLDLKSDEIRVWAGSGIENIIDGTRARAAFAQPSGLATDGKWLYVADSEVSGIRAVSLTSDRVDTVVGVNLFGFGDEDGKGDAVRLQHCLGLAYGGEGQLFVADSYNNKIKLCRPQTRAVATFVGSRAGGFDDDPPLFDEPGGLSIAGPSLYVADTNNHAVRVVNLATRQVATLDLSSVPKPQPTRRAPSFPGATTVEMAAQKVAPGDALKLNVSVFVPAGYKVSPDAPMPYLVEAGKGSDGLALGASVPATGATVKPPSASWSIDVPLNRPAKEGETIELKVSASAFLCRSALCEVHNTVWTVPVEFTSGGATTVTLKGEGKNR